MNAYLMEITGKGFCGLMSTKMWLSINGFIMLAYLSTRQRLLDTI